MNSPVWSDTMEDEGCVFCQIISGKLPASVIHEDDKVTVILDIRPFAKAHMLIIPRQHCQNFTYLPDEIISHMAVVAKKMAKALKASSIPSAGFNYYMTEGGPVAGQEVQHCHLHCIPRNPEDGISLRKKGKIMSPNRGELDSIKEKIIQVLKQEL